MAERHETREVERILRLFYQDVGFDRFIDTIERTHRGIVKNEKSAATWNRTFRESKSAVAGLTGAMDKMLGPLNSVVGLFAVGGLSLKGIVKQNYDLNKSLLVLSSQYGKYGLGIVQTEQKVEAFAASNRMLRSEVMNLASAFNKGFIAGGANFEGFLKMLKNTVGNNTEAMADLQNQVISLSQEYIGFGQIIRGVNEKGEMTETQKDATRALLEFGSASGKVSIQHRKTLQDLLYAQERLDGSEPKADEKRLTEIEKQIEAVRSMEKAIEDVSRELNSRVMPVLEKISSALSGIDGFAKWAADLILVGAGLMSVLKIIKPLDGITRRVGRGIMSMAGRGAAIGTTATGTAGAVGTAGVSGTASSIGGAGATSKFSKFLPNIGKEIGWKTGFSIGKALPTAVVAGVASEFAGDKFDSEYAKRTGGEKSYDTFGGAVGKTLTQVGAGTMAGAGTGAAIGGGVGALFGGVGAVPGAIAGAAVGAGVGTVVGTGTAVWDAGTEGIKNYKAAVALSKEALEITAQISNKYREMYQDQASNAKTPTARIVAEKRIEMQNLQDDLIKQQVKDSGFWGQLMGGGSSTEAEEMQAKLQGMRKQVEQLSKKSGTENKAIEEEEKKFKLSELVTANRQREEEQFELQRQSIQVQTDLLQEQVGLYNVMVEKIKLTGNLSSNNIAAVSDGIDLARSGLEENAARNRQLLAETQERHKRGEEYITRMKARNDTVGMKNQLNGLQLLMKSGEEAMAAMSPDSQAFDDMKRTLQLQGEEEEKIKEKILANETTQDQMIKAQYESQRGMVQLEKEYQSITRQTVEIERAALTIYDARMQAQEASINLAQAEISLADNLSMGLAASASMRMEAVQRIGGAIELEQAKIAVANERIEESLAKRTKAEYDLAKAENEGNAPEADKLKNEIATEDAVLLALATDRLNIETGIVNKQMQQAQMLRALRDGYISSIAAMTTGAGVFTKIIVDQNKNLGTIMRSAGSVPTAIRTGSDGGGFRTSERFTPSGIGSSMERQRSPIVKPEWGLDSRNGFDINGKGSLSDVASAVSAAIPDKIDEMKADMASAAENVSNISRLLGGSPEQMNANLKEAQGGSVNVGQKATEHIRRTTGGSVSMSMSATDMKEIVTMLSKEMSSLVKDAMMAAKQDIMSDIANGIG